MTSTDAIRWHTEARQQPRLIGKDVSGKKIPGGPYTVYQVAGLAVLPIGLWTKPLWGPAVPSLGALMMLVGTTVVAVWAIGLIDWTWSPINTVGGWVHGAAHALNSPAGTLTSRSNRVQVLRAAPSARQPASTIGYPLPPAPTTKEDSHDMTPPPPCEPPADPGALWAQPDEQPLDHLPQPALLDTLDECEPDVGSRAPDQGLPAEPATGSPQSEPRLSALEAFLAGANHRS